MAAPNKIDQARIWMQTQLALSVHELEAKFAGANITLLVSMPGCGDNAPLAPLVHKPAFSHATTAQPVDLEAVLRSLLSEMTQ